MSQKILVSALVAGALAGILAVALQFAFVIPLLLEGELYETGQRVHFANGVAESEAGAPALGWDIRRHSLTVAFSLITWIGFSLILVAAMAAGALRGTLINGRNGAVWGLMGFLVVQLAPAASLPPEVPGSIAAEVGSRYLWWIATIATSTMAVAVLAFRPSVAAVLGAAVLLLVPHVFGAPTVGSYFGVAPPELAALFVTRSLAVSALVWAAMGAMAGWIWSRG